MPLDDGRTPTNSELDKRLKLLEDSKISVKQLPMTELRKALAKEPQNPTDLLLPHSIGPELLSATGKSAAFNLGMSSLVTNESWVTIPGGEYITPESANYLIVSYVDTELLSSGFGVFGMFINGGQVAGNLNATTVQRMGLTLCWAGFIGVNGIIQMKGERSGGSFTIYGGNLTILRV